MDTTSPAIGVPEEAVVDYNRARDALTDHYRKRERGGFSFGCNDFPPFIYWNGKKGGPLYDAMLDVASDLGTKPRPVACNWNSFEREISDAKVATIAVPILPIHERSLPIVLLGGMSCCAIFFNKQKVGERDTNTCRRSTERISDILAEWPEAQGERRAERHLMDAIRRELRAVAGLGEGLAAGPDYYEYKKLTENDIKIERDLAGASLLRPALEAADEGFLCTVDVNTVRLAEEAVSADQFERTYEFMPLFGDYIQVAAGLPFERENIGKYLYYRWRYDFGGFRSRLVSSLGAATGNGHLTPPAFRFIDTSELPILDDWPGILSRRNAAYYRQLAHDVSLGKIFRPGASPFIDINVVALPPGDPLPLMVRAKTRMTAVPAIPAPASELGAPSAVTETILQLGPAGHEYLLRAAEILNFDGRKLQVGSLVAEGSTLTEALATMGIQLHRDFQYLWQRSPHERTPEETAVWERLEQIVDVDAYLREHPPEETVIGRVERADVTGLTVLLLTESPEQRISSTWSALPPSAAAAKPGDCFSARIRRFVDGPIAWREWTIRPPLREDEEIWDALDEAGDEAME